METSIIKACPVNGGRSPDCPSLCASVMPDNKEITACSSSLSDENSKKKGTQNAALQHLATRMRKCTKLGCKSILQEYTQKCKLPFPIYTTVMLGELQHLPSFQASVEVAGTCYKGGVCKRKKLAEAEAAKHAIRAICWSKDESSSTSIRNHRKEYKRNIKRLMSMLHTRRGSRSLSMEMMLKECAAKVKKLGRPKKK